MRYQFLFCLVIVTLAVISYPTLACSYVFPADGYYISSISSTLDPDRYKVTFDSYNRNTSDNIIFNKAILNIKTGLLEKITNASYLTQEAPQIEWTLFENNYTSQATLTNDTISWTIINTTGNLTLKKIISLSQFGYPQIFSLDLFLVFEKYDVAFLFINPDQYFVAELHSFTSTNTTNLKSSALQYYYLSNKSFMINRDSDILMTDGEGSACDKVIFYQVNSSDLTLLISVKIWSDYTTNKASNDVVISSITNFISVVKLTTSKKILFSVSQEEIAEFITLKDNDLDIVALTSIFFGGLSAGAIIAIIIKKQSS
jgi:hypothetical protein